MALSDPSRVSVKSPKDGRSASSSRSNLSPSSSQNKKSAKKNRRLLIEQLDLDGLLPTSPALPPDPLPRSPAGGNRSNNSSTAAADEKLAFLSKELRAYHNLARKLTTHLREAHSRISSLQSENSFLKSELEVCHQAVAASAPPPASGSSVNPDTNPDGYVVRILTC